MARLQARTANKPSVKKPALPDAMVLWYYAVVVLWSGQPAPLAPELLRCTAQTPGSQPAKMDKWQDFKHGQRINRR